MEYAKYNDITVVSTYIDRALSAKTDNRPNFQKMIKDSAKRIFDLIIVWKLDRFARNRYDSAYYKNALKKNGVKVVSAKESISEGAEGIILESVLEGYALITCNYKDGTEKITLEDIENSDISSGFKAQKNKPERECSDLSKSGDPYGIRIGQKRPK